MLSTDHYSLLDTIPIGLIVIGKDKRIRWINQAGKKVIGDPTGERVVGNICHQLICPNLVGSCPVWDKGQTIDSSERILIHRDGRQIPVLKTTVSLMQDGEPVLLEAFVDISEQKRIENDLSMSKSRVEQANAELEEKNRQLEQAIFQASQMARKCLEMHTEVARLNEELEARVASRTKEVNDLLRQKDSFVNRLGHDLRTPLMPLVGLLPLAERRVSDEKVKHMIQLAMDSVGYMNRLVERTLDLARFSVKEEIPLEEIVLWREVREAVSSMMYTFEEHHISVNNNVSSSIRVRVDPMELWEVLQNLLSNAVKYMGPEGSITIDANRCGDMVTVSISDTGIGMQEEETSRIFEEFYKVDTSRHDRNSIGLGLTICKQIITRRGGKIWAWSAGPQQGTTIYFTLPAAERQGVEDEQDQNIRDEASETMEISFLGETIP